MELYIHSMYNHISSGLVGWFPLQIYVQQCSMRGYLLLQPWPKNALYNGWERAYFPELLTHVLSGPVVPSGAPCWFEMYTTINVSWRQWLYSHYVGQCQRQQAGKQQRGQADSRLPPNLLLVFPYIYYQFPSSFASPHTLPLASERGWHNVDEKQLYLWLALQALLYLIIFHG